MSTVVSLICLGPSFQKMTHHFLAPGSLWPTSLEKKSEALSLSGCLHANCLFYCSKKKEMLLENEGFGAVNEQQLYHGTEASVVDAICRKGFDWRVCGKNGTMYGQGMYITFSYLSGVGARGLSYLGKYHSSHQNWEILCSLKIRTAILNGLKPYKK